jgi:hypothetical protein
MTDKHPRPPAAAVHAGVPPRAAVAPVRKPGVSPLGIVGWVLAVCTGVVLVFMLLSGHRRAALEESAGQAAIAKLRATEQPRIEAASAELTKLHAERAQLVTQVNAAQRAARQQQNLLTAKENTIEQLQLNNTAFDTQFGVLKTSLGFPYATLEDLLADREKLLAKARDTAMAAPVSAPAPQPAPAPAAPPAKVSILDLPAKEPAEPKDTRPAKPAIDLRDPIRPVPAPEVAKAVAPADNEPPASRTKLDSKLFTIACDTSQQDSKRRGTLNATIKNGDARNDYPGLMATVVIYAFSKGEPDRLRVLKVQRRTFDLKRQSAEAVFNDSFELWYDSFGYVVVLCDAEGEIVLGRASRPAHLKTLGNFLKLEERNRIDGAGVKLREYGEP